jgi:hypothetical protein
MICKITGAANLAPTRRRFKKRRISATFTSAVDEGVGVTSAGFLDRALTRPERQSSGRNNSELQLAERVAGPRSSFSDL